MYQITRRKMCNCVLRKLLECGIASQESVKFLNPNVTEKKMISCICILSGNILRSKCNTKVIEL